MTHISYSVKYPETYLLKIHLTLEVVDKAYIVIILPLNYSGIIHALAFCTLVNRAAVLNGWIELII